MILLVLLLRFGPKLMRGWFGAVVRSRSHELFTLNVLLATLLFAWLTRQAGLSMELGAFVAGMLIAETEYRYQVEEDIKPFRDVLLGLFFVTIGARLDPQKVRRAPAVAPEVREHHFARHAAIGQHARAVDLDAHLAPQRTAPRGLSGFLRCDGFV